MSAIATLSLSRLDTLLLRAALLDGEPARAAFGTLQAEFDLDGLDYGRQRLLPLLHRNLVALGIEDGRLGRLRGVRHYHWAKNQTRMKAAAPVLWALRAAGVPTVLLKGAALLASGLGDMSLRPMDDIDILVPAGQRKEAIAILEQQAYPPRHTQLWHIVGDDEFATPGWPFGNHAGQDIDLHWYLLHVDCRPGADDGVWRRIRPAELAGAPTAVLSPADQILHAIAHAANWSIDSLLRWAGDVALILRREGASMRWEPLLEEARLRRLAPPLHDGLKALRDAVGVPIPHDVLRELKRLSGIFDRFEHRLRASPLERRTRVDREWLALFDGRRKTPATMRRPLPAAIGPYLRARYPNTDAPTANLAIYAALGAPRRLRRTLGVGRWTSKLDARSLAPLSAGFDPQAAVDTRDACIGGWAYPEAEGRWTTAREAHLAWHVPPEWRVDLEIAIDAKPFWPPNRAEPRVDIWLNETYAGAIPPHRDGVSPTLTVRLPAVALAGRASLVLTVAVARLHSPMEFGLSLDARPLGAFLRRVTFRRTA